MGPRLSDDRSEIRESIRFTKILIVNFSLLKRRKGLFQASLLFFI